MQDRQFSGAMLLAAALLAVAALTAPEAAAQAQSEVLFTRKAWEVRVVSFENHTMACLAQVRIRGEAFSIWTGGSGQIRLQFHSTDWELKKGKTNLEIQIDRRRRWSLTNAERYKSSVFLNIPNDNNGALFLSEVMHGNRLYLRNGSGQMVQSYSLAGSSASMNALAESARLLKRDEQNPID